MSGIVCPKCGGKVAAADVNVAKDVLLCRACEEIFPLGQQNEDALTGWDVPAAFRLEETPKGVVCAETPDGTVLTMRLRSWPVAIFLVPFTLLWGGGSMSGIYGSQITKGEFDLLLCLVGLPFAAGTVFLAGLTAYLIAGREEVGIGDGGCWTFRGVGRFGKRRTFAADEITGVVERQREQTSSESGRRIVHEVVLARAEDELCAVSSEDAAVRTYVRFALRRLLIGVQGGRKG